MTEKEAEELCKMVRVGVDLSKKYQPKTKEELKDLIEELIGIRGNEADLNDIDVSQITDMNSLFAHSPFNGDISKWDVSNVEDMWGMFYGSQFNGDISNWDVRRVKNMSYMFAGSKFNGDISKWNVSKVENMGWMFSESQFNGNISNWDVSRVKDMEGMFECSKFNGDISKWNVKEVINMKKMFANNKSANIPDWCPNESLLRRILSFLMCRYPDPEKSFWRPLYTVLLFLIGIVVLALLEYYDPMGKYK